MIQYIRTENYMTMENFPMNSEWKCELQFGFNAFVES